MGVLFRRRRAAAGELTFLTWAAERGLVPWDVPPLGREMPVGSPGRRELVGAFRGLLDGSGRPFVVRQVVITAPGGARTWWTSAMCDGTDHVACATEPLLEAGDLDALLEVLDAEVSAATARPGHIRLVA